MLIITFLMSFCHIQAPLTDGLECGDPALGLCQQSECLNNECIFSPDQFGVQTTLCLCGLCVECPDPPVQCTDPNDSTTCTYCGKIYFVWSHIAYFVLLSHTNIITHLFQHTPGGNCEFNTVDIVARPPSSLLVSVPCEYDNITLAVANCAPKVYYRDELGYFNISKDLGSGECGNDNPGKFSTTIFYHHKQQTLTH